MGLQNIVAIPRDSLNLASGPKNAPNGAETSILTKQLRNAYVAYLKDLAYSVQAGGISTVEFRIYINGARANFAEYCTRNTQMGQIGNPQSVKPIELPPGALFEIRVSNSDSVSYTVECDGNIDYYDSPIF